MAARRGDPAIARALRERLVADSDYMKDWMTNKDKQTVLGALRWIATGHPASAYGAPPEDASAIEHQDEQWQVTVGCSAPDRCAQIISGRESDLLYG